MKPEKDYRKPCTLCEQPRHVLVRCQIDETRRWHFVCPGSCWKRVSGGVIDGDDKHKLYRYGGMWKNKHEAVSAKKPRRVGKEGDQRSSHDPPHAAPIDEAGGSLRGDGMLKGDKAEVNPIDDSNAST